MGFLKKFVSEPQKIGSITPSSKFLTRKVLEEIDWIELNSIVELGAGTGIFTDYIVSHKKETCRVVAVEQDEMMRRRLEELYPQVIFGKRAESLPNILAQAGLQEVDYIVSGLPFAIFNQELRIRIIEVVYASLKSEGKFVTFQYSLQMRNLLKQYFSIVEIKFEILNFPPAFIYYCQK